MGKVVILVNRKGGTVRDRGPGRIEAQLRDAVEAAGWDADIRLIHPRAFASDIRALLKRKDPPEVIVIGGGDGSLSTAAGVLAGTDTALGVLPLGTMNLYARALGMPLDTGEAIAALATARPRQLDLLDINGHQVLQHATMGLTAKVIRIRESMPYRTRFGRLTNGVIAWMRAIRVPRPVRVVARGGDGEDFSRVATALLISNNRLPEEIGETPVSQDMTKGEIGVYVCASRRRADVVALTLATTLGIWRSTELVEEIVVRDLTIETGRSRVRMVIDGELVRLKTPLKCSMRRKCLKVLTPRPANDLKS
ncbi:MAG: diacylglycerol kinase family protein [Pseudomonadota bacterium]|nr:diacylglycerol kinase family protein [Pseudomonadota bacterium]